MIDAGALGALIVDDEPLARQTVRMLLGRDPEVHVIAECGSGAEALEVLAHAQVALLFLDIRLPGLSGLDALARLAPPPTTVLITAFAEHAVSAFELEVVDYLLKPFEDDRFARALARAKRHALGRAAAPAPPPPAAIDPPARGAAALERLVIRNAGRISTLAVDDIDWIEAQDYYVEIHIGGRSHLVRQTLQHLSASLDPRRFVRIHRKTIVNVRRVKELEPMFHGEHVVFLHDGTRLKLSRTYRDQLDRLLGLA